MECMDFKIVRFHTFIFLHLEMCQPVYSVSGTGIKHMRERISGTVQSVTADILRRV